MCIIIVLTFKEFHEKKKKTNPKSQLSDLENSMVLTLYSSHWTIKLAKKTKTKKHLTSITGKLTKLTIWIK